ncbi:KL [Symbiodinium sp. KB8]|nr:KL [Symbiodinium sp. KB8]
MSELQGEAASASVPVPDQSQGGLPWRLSLKGTFKALSDWGDQIERRHFDGNFLEAVSSARHAVEQHRHLLTEASRIGGELGSAAVKLVEEAAGRGPDNLDLSTESCLEATPASEFAQTPLGRLPAPGIADLWQEVNRLQQDLQLHEELRKGRSGALSSQDEALRKLRSELMDSRCAVQEVLEERQRAAGRLQGAERSFEALQEAHRALSRLRSAAESELRQLRAAQAEAEAPARSAALSGSWAWARDGPEIEALKAAKVELAELLAEADEVRLNARRESAQLAHQLEGAEAENFRLGGSMAKASVGCERRAFVARRCILRPGFFPRIATTCLEALDGTGRQSILVTQRLGIAIPSTQASAKQNVPLLPRSLQSCTARTTMRMVHDAMPPWRPNRGQPCWRPESLLLGVLPAEEVLRLQSGAAKLKWEAELAKLQSYGHRFYLLSIPWDALLQGVEEEGAPRALAALASAVESVRRHGLEPVACLPLDEAALAASHLETLRSSIRLWVTQVKLRPAGSEQELGRRRRWGTERDTHAVAETAAATEKFFLRVHKVLQAHALLAQELFREEGGLQGHGEGIELGIMISADWMEAVAEPNAKSREAAEWILQSQIGSVLSPIFGDGDSGYPPGLGLADRSFSVCENASLRRTSFLMISHHFAGRVRFSEASQSSEVLHSAASPLTLSKVLRWLAWHGYVPPLQGRLGGLHVAAGGTTNQAVTLRALHRACEKSVPLRGYWTSEVESPSPEVEEAFADVTKAALFAKPSTEMGQHGCLAWMDPKSVLVTLDFLELCACLNCRPDTQKLVSQINLLRRRLEQKSSRSESGSSWRIRDARWSSLLDEVIAKSCERRYGSAHRVSDVRPSSASTPSISESAVEFFLQFRRQRRRAVHREETAAQTEAISRTDALPATATPTMKATLEAVVQLYKVGEEEPRLPENVGSEVARVRALGEALQRKPRPPALDFQASLTRGREGSADPCDLDHVRVQASLAASCFWWGARTREALFVRKKAHFL